MLVVLRLSLGCHFLYEGVWKIENADVFSAAPFLSEAKGPAARFFYAMLPDLHGRDRLQVTKDDKGKNVVSTERYVAAWERLKDRVVSGYGLDEQQTAGADALLAKYKTSLNAYLAEKADAVAVYFESLDRFQADQSAGNNGAAHQRERTWKRERELRKEVGGWLNEIEAMGDGLQNGLWNLLTDEQKAMGPITKGWNPFAWQRTDQINFAVTFALTAIGLCLVLGLFTRLAALAGGAFMASVVLTQPAWPGLYPPDPAVVGHALLINKDFVEMVALFTIATTAVGRWGGLDYFVYYLVVNPFLSKKVQNQSK